MKFRFSFYFLSVCAAFFLFSCTSRKNIIYFQGNLNSSEASKPHNPILQPGDLVSITVFGMDVETAKPFNLPVLVSTSNSTGYREGIASPFGYLIDIEGNIDFPVVGKIKLAGLQRSVIVDTLKNRLKPYLTNPTILIRILNFKVTVLGEVNNPGTFTIPNERVTLPEALGIAGDLRITGKRNNILVIRDVDGKKTETRVDLTSTSLFTSPVYYLNQNDIVYVEPNRARVNSSVTNQTNASIVISAVSLLGTILLIFRK